ncbi:MAG: hypothetical protein V1928_05505 [Parcubacteria group bacterium]
MNCKTNLYVEFLYPSYEFGQYHCSLKKVKKIDLALKQEDMLERTVGFRYYVYLSMTAIFNGKKEVLKSRKIYVTPNYFFNAEKFTIKEFQNVNDNEGKTISLRFITKLIESKLQIAIRFHNGKWGILQPTDVLL